MAGNRGGHAQARVGIHVRRADESFHQLVGDVIVLGQKLAGEIESNRIAAVARDDALEALRDPVESDRPVDARKAAVRLPQHGIEQTFAQPQRLAERRALGADAAEIGGMVGIARDRGPAESVRPCKDAATHAAIRAGRAHGRRVRGGRVHAHAATRVARSRPNTRSSRRRSIDDPARMRSRYQGPSAVSPNSTAPMRRPSATTSFL